MEYEDKRARDRYVTESARLLGVLNQRLSGREWVMGADYSIADISLLGWVRNLIGFYEARARGVRPVRPPTRMARSRPGAPGRSKGDQYPASPLKSAVGMRQCLSTAAAAQIQFTRCIHE